MHISKIKLHNIRCFEDETLNLEDTNGRCKGFVILGDNGVGKTTLLRSIAMSLSGEGSASGLLDGIEGGMIKDNAKDGYVRLTLKSEDNKDTYEITTYLIKESVDTDIVDRQETNPEGELFPWKKIFSCGYGAPRGIRGEAQYSRYTVKDAVNTLFVPDSGYLQGAELSIRRIKDTLDSVDILEKVLNWVDKILMHPKGSIKLEAGGLFLSDSNGVSRPIEAVSDGHYGTLTMICDLLGWVLLYDKEALKGELSGIVIIDEIEQHLHPKWQRKIIGLLKEVFPKIQFIVSTHSPLVAGNAGKLPGGDNGLKLFYAGYTGQRSEISEIGENFSELGCDQILSSGAFGNLSNLSINAEVEKVLKEASILATKDQRTPEDEVKY
ncbi:MAG: AAA family ATPase, partial [Candidatus Anammoxibacter sp.]